MLISILIKYITIEDRNVQVHLLNVYGIFSSVDLVQTTATIQFYYNIRVHAWMSTKSGNNRFDCELQPSGTYPWTFVTQIFHNGQPSHSDDFNLTKRNPWFSSLLVSSKPISSKSWREPQALKYRINWDIHTPYAGAAGNLLHINGKFTMGKLKSYLLS